MVANVSDEEMQEHYDNFFEDVFVECEDRYGEIEEMNVCDNLGDHLVGNVYIKVRLLFVFIEFYCNLLIDPCIFSFAVKKTLNAQQKNWIIVGSAVVQFTQNYLPLLISVKPVADNTKWVNALVLDFAISCIWNRFREIFEGTFRWQWIPTQDHLAETSYIFPCTDICIHVVAEDGQGVARDHHNNNNNSKGAKDATVPEIAVVPVAEIDVNDQRIVKDATKKTNDFNFDLHRIRPCKNPLEKAITDVINFKRIVKKRDNNGRSDVAFRRFWSDF